MKVLILVIMLITLQQFTTLNAKIPTINIKGFKGLSHLVKTLNKNHPLYGAIVRSDKYRKLQDEEEKKDETESNSNEEEDNEEEVDYVPSMQINEEAAEEEDNKEEKDETEANNEEEEEEE